MKLQNVILLVLALQGVRAQAGVGAHGGNVVNCPNTPLVTLDYYNATLPTASGAVAVVDVNSMTEVQAFQFVRSRFDGSPFQWVFDVHTQGLGPIADWIATDLKSIDDSNEPYALPLNCIRETGAARQGTSMYVDPGVMARLPAPQLGLLHAHEVLYEISRQDSSAPIRDMFRVILAKKFDPDLLNRQMTLINLHFSLESNLRYGTWMRDTPGSEGPPGYFTHDLNSNGPDTTIQYLERDPKSSGSYLAAAHFMMDCPLKAMVCTIKDVKTDTGSPPDLRGCGITMSSPKAMALSCGWFTTGAVTFHREGWTD